MDKELILEARPCSTDLVSESGPKTLIEAKIRPERFCGLLNECTKRSAERHCIASLAHEVARRVILFDVSVDDVMNNGFKKHFDALPPTSAFVYFDGYKRRYFEKTEALEEVRKLAEKFLKEE